MIGWEIVHEMDLEDGTPTCYAKLYSGQQWWITKYPTAWAAEVKVSTMEDGRTIRRVRDFKTPESAARWIEKYHTVYADDAQ